ncbi:MAG: cadherin-like domain-containing protein, partial [Xenococcaceae cyanobacterium MO_188.B32]|nr:cadherin-like domain-containing protein [Xenococcaceae cyanobacterium MO_188.B32]
ALTAYLNGVKVGEGEGMELESHRDNIGIGGLNQTTKFHDGEAQKNSKHSLGGSIDEVRVYNRALSAEEISLLFNPNHDPVAVDDEALTVENTEVILLGSSLLANDTDLDGNSLSLTAVGNATNGSVTRDEGGNAIFTPELNFSGDASFEYTVSDGEGGTATATVTVTVLPQTSPIPLGTNLHRLAAWSPQLPFLNAFKSARQWIPQNWGVTKNNEDKYEYVWDTGEFTQLELDENGWVKSLPAPEDEPEYSSVGTLLFRNVGSYPGGKYVVLYEGEGTIEYALDAQKDESASTPGRDVIDVNPSNAGIWLRITSTDPNDTGDYLRNIRVLPEEYEYADYQVFNPVFLEKIQPFNTIRFMDWMFTNNSKQSEWSERPVPESSIFSGEMASLEKMVELANRTAHEEYGIDAIAIAPYFGSYLGNPTYEAEIESWIDDDDPDVALNNLFKELTQGGVVSNGYDGGALQQAYDWTTAYVDLANRQNLEIITYESGQHLNGNTGVQDNQAIGDLFIAANREPRMGEVYQEYVTTLHSLGLDLSMNYTDVSSYNKWGSWGSLEHINQEDSPKYNVIKSATTKITHDLPPQLGTLTDNLSRLGILVEGDSLNLNANYTDVGITDFHTVEFDWGDGSPIEVEEKTPLLGDLGKVSGSHVYNSEGIYTATLTVTDDDNLFDNKSISINVAKKVELDWNPGSKNKKIKLTGNGNISVAILGTANFDVAGIDPTSVRADDEKDVLLDGGAISASANNSSLEDTNGDGFQDLGLFFGKSDLSEVVSLNSEPFLSDNQIYLLGTNSQLDSSYFFGMQQADAPLQI